MHLLEEVCPIVIFRAEEYPSSVHRGAIIYRRYPVIMKLNTRISIEALASGFDETQNGMGEIVCDEDIFDLVLKMLVDPTASCP